MSETILTETPATPATPAAPASSVPSTPAAATPAPEVKETPAPDAAKAPASETLLGAEPQTAEQVAEAEAKKAEAIKNETPEQKAEREKAEAKAAEESGKVVPEKYTAKAPEGMNIDQAMLDKLSPTLKEAGVTQAAFQKIIDAYGPLVKAQQETAIANQQKQAIDSFKSMIKDWGTETQKWLGAKPAEAMAPAARAIEKLSSDPKGLRAILEETGVGNHKLVVEMFIKAGKLLGQDSFPGGAPAPGDKSEEARARAMFPSATG